ncbi:MAG: N,N-dimethylformamidase beta subunit family domain-containing protein [Solirubrobacterales bacterium]
MSRATLISRVVFALLVLATFTAFFVAQRLKRTDPLVYAVQVKKYVSPNGDELRDRARLRFRTKERDVVTVELIDRAQRVVRTLAEDRHLGAGVHRFLWNGRARSGDPVPDGAYRVRISMSRSGRTFIPDKFFVVDTAAPRLSASVIGEHTVSALTDMPASVRLRFSGVAATRRAEFLVYEVRGRRTGLRPVATFLSTRGKAEGEWDLSIGAFRKREEPCFGDIVERGRKRPAPPGSYVIVARSCDAAGNIGLSSRVIPPRVGSLRGEPGVTLRGVEIAPSTEALRPGDRAAIAVNAPAGGYRFRLRNLGGQTIANGRGRGSTLRMTVPGDAADGVYRLTVLARRTIKGSRGVAHAPVVVGSPGDQALLVAFPSTAWQVTNPVDTDGDGFGDGFETLSAGRQKRVALDRTLAAGAMPTGFAEREGALAEFLSEGAGPAFRAVTDAQLATRPDAFLRGRKAVLFAGDERWITPQLGAALRAFVKRGGRVAFFAPDAFRRTVRFGGGSISGPSPRAERDIFGESISVNRVAPAPVIAFADSLSLFGEATGLFTTFEQSRSRARAAAVATAAGREEGRPAVVVYQLAKGFVFRIGVRGWQQQLATDADVAATTRRILQELTR